MMDRLQAKKSLGQNFLIDKNISNKIVGLLEANAEDHILEIGPGTGALTELMAIQGFKVTAVELDTRAYELLNKKFKNNPNIKIINEDFLKFDLEKFTKSETRNIKIIGNIPYNISGPIFFKLFESYKNIERSVLTVQKEVAKRITSAHGTKIYGILSVIAARLGNAKIAFDIPPQCFRPVPKVMSSVLVLKFDENGPDKAELKKFINFIKTAFNQRRKMLGNSIKSYLKNMSDELNNDNDFQELLKKRPEQLPLEKLLVIYKKIKE